MLTHWVLFEVHIYSMRDPQPVPCKLNTANPQNTLYARRFPHLTVLIDEMLYSHKFYINEPIKIFSAEELKIYETFE